MPAFAEILASLREQLLVVGGNASTRGEASTQLPLLDAFASAHGGVALGAVHEVLAGPEQSVDAFALLLALSAIRQNAGGWIAWSDPERSLYPPALKAAGIPVERLILLRPKSIADELWALAECMRCSGVAATVGHVGRMTSVQARRLQLAVEQGGGVGVLVRPDDARSANYAAATRWRVRAIAGRASPTQVTQRWEVELVYGHGGRVGERFILEIDRETHRCEAKRTAVAVPDRAADAGIDRDAENPVHRAAELAVRPRAAATPTRRSIA